jgi:hypothetical protein
MAGPPGYFLLDPGNATRRPLLVSPAWQATVARSPVIAVPPGGLLGTAWLRVDIAAMPALKRYDRSHGCLAVILGAYLVGAPMAFAWPLRAASRVLRRPRRPEPSPP